MKNSNLKNGQKLSREAQKQITGGEKNLCNLSGCFSDYIGDGQGRCVVPPCAPPYLGTEVIDAQGRWKCCY
ncbi:hypothetical protein GCM10023210_29510 [Chryseobacterium ginsengisoli]|uniref:Bacteriocin n=1 Tax=Chryseobacterium ginsengisoli TaxID=363853 RepID=A0ABP9MLA7_9FLAO